jgi:SAM-dependent methyltransferase
MEARWIRHHLPRSAGRIVDVGCGNGSLFPFIGEARSLGIDLDTDALRHALGRCATVPLLRADAGCLPLADRCLDAITAQHVIEHLPSVEHACREWLRVLRPGGRLLVLTPNGRFRDPSVYDDATHVQIFDDRALSATLEAAGFVITDLRTIGLPWFTRHRGTFAGWRLRRFVVRQGPLLSRCPGWRWLGQTLCCAARRPVP